MSERKMLLGSEGHLDYLVVQERGNVALAIKPFLSGSVKYGIAFGVRIRTALLPSADHKSKVQGVKWQDIWPEFAWLRTGHDRASNMVLVPSGHMMWEYDALQEQTGDTASVAVGFMTKRLEHDLVDNLDAIKFLQEGWTESIKSLADAFPAVPEVVPETMTASYIGDLFEAAGEGDVSPLTAIKSAATTKPNHKFSVIEGGKGSANQPDEEIAVLHGSLHGVDDDLEAQDGTLDDDYDDNGNLKPGVDHNA